MTPVELRSLKIDEPLTTIPERSPSPTPFDDSKRSFFKDCFAKLCCCFACCNAKPLRSKVTVDNPTTISSSASLTTSQTSKVIVRSGSNSPTTVKRESSLSFHSNPLQTPSSKRASTSRRDSTPSARPTHRRGSMTKSRSFSIEEKKEFRKHIDEGKNRILALLNTHGGKEALMLYAKRAWVTENVSFIIAFNKLPEEPRKADYENIYNRYIKIKVPLQINLSYERRIAIEKALQQDNLSEVHSELLIAEKDILDLQAFQSLALKKAPELMELVAEV